MKVFTLYTDPDTALKMHRLAHAEHQSTRKYWGNLLQQALTSVYTSKASVLMDQVVPSIQKANQELARIRRKFRTLFSSSSEHHELPELNTTSNMEWNESLEYTKDILTAAKEVLGLEAGRPSEEILLQHRRASIAVYKVLGPGLRENTPSTEALTLARITVALGATTDPQIWPPPSISDFESPDKVSSTPVVK